MGSSFDQLTNIDKALHETERRGEFIAAIFRMMISVALLVSIWALVPLAQTTHPIFAVAIAYGLTSVVGFGLAVGRVYHPTLPFVFVLIDCAIVALALTMLARMNGMGMSATLSLPLFSLAFVILIHASLRYRPKLVAFGAVVFIGLLLGLPRLLDLGAGPDTDPMITRRGHEMMAGTGESQFVPLVFFLLAAVLLFYIVQRTRGLANLALVDGKRVAQLTRFFSPEIANRLVSQDYASGAYGARQRVAVLFIDIRGFTRLAETMSPEDLSEFLSSFRSAVCAIIFQHGGTVDKFIGDAVLAVFGTPTVRADDAKRAFDGVLAISLGVQEWFDRRTLTGKSAALVGIGAHYGDVFAGVIESGDILEHTIIGDTVNVAQRLERLSRELNANVVISSDLLEAAKIEPDSVDLVCMQDHFLSGHDRPITLFHDKLRFVEKA